MVVKPRKASTAHAASASVDTASISRGETREQHETSAPLEFSFNAIKIFSTTLGRDREHMGETITRWLKEHSTIEVVDKVVTQSSDKEFHCLTLTIFYKEKPV